MAEADDKKAPGYSSDDEILEKARKEYKMCCDADSDNREVAKDDLQFLLGGENQWTPLAVSQRKADGRPIITVNDLPAMLHQVTNDQRQNRPAIKVHPVDSGADPKTAKIVQGMIRHIEYDSNADVAYDRSVNSGAAIGFGYWRLVTEYESESSFNQKIMFKSIRNALSVRIDPLSTAADGSDMRYAFVENVIGKEDFEREYPKAEANNSTLLEGGNNYAGWITENTVLVCEYYCIEKTPEEIVLLSNGESGFKSDLVELPPGITVINTRHGERSKVMWRKITATDVLETAEIKCKWIPVFPVYGDEVDIEGKVYRSGIVRNAKGPAQSYNVMMSSATEAIALQPRQPFIMAEGQEEGHEPEFAQANNRNFPYLLYKPTELEGKLVPPPQRQHMADVPTGMLAMAMHAQDNKKKATGLFDASLGAKGTATSGVQEKAQQREGDVANFHYYDGLLRTIRHCGRCLIDMIPHYYDTQRVVRVLGEDDTATFETINQPNANNEPGEDGAIRAFLNDVTTGSFDITVSAGPSYSTLRQEAAEGMADNMAKNPALWGVIGDLYVKNQDWPGADAMAERIKKTIPPQLTEGEEGDDKPAEVIQTPQGPLPIAQVPQMLAQMQERMTMLTEALEKAKAGDVANKSRELDIKDKEADTHAREADISAIQAQRDAGDERLKNIAAAEKAQAEALKAEADLVRARNEAMEREESPAPTLEEIAALIEANKPQMPEMLSIKAPSGQVYVVDMKTKH
jgi:predicted small secreted protein